MSDDTNAFQQRLSRINARRGTDAGASPGNARGNGPAPIKGGGLVLKVVGAAGFLCMAGIALAVTSGITNGPMGQALQDTRAGTEQTPSAVGSLLNRIAAVTSPAPKATPADFLPPAPDGWVRIAERDAREPGLLDTLQKGWPRSGMGVVALDQHPAWPQTRQFVQTNARPDVEARVLARTSARAIYLGPRGEYVFFRLQFLGERVALGSPGHPEAWLDALMEKTRKQLETDEVIERVTLSGVGMLNRTRQPGTSLIARPIGSDLHSLNGLQLMVPLTEHAVVDARGLTTPETLGTMIANMDRAGIQPPR